LPCKWLKIDFKWLEIHFMRPKIDLETLEIDFR